MTMRITGRGAINPWECDQWGHLNVQFYAAKASEAQAALASLLGLVPSRLRGGAVALLPLTDRILFKRELRAGDTFFIRSGVRTISPHGTLALASRMVNQETGVESAAFETRWCWADLASAAPQPWPEDVLGAALAVAGDLPQAPLPRPMAHAVPAATNLERAQLTYRGSVQTWECDANGTAPPRAHIARFADCVPHLFRSMHMSKDELLQRQLGSAALDYDIAYHQPMRVGQAVEIRSGLLDMGEKVFHFFHHLVDSSSAAPITSIVVAALFFDLVARKSVPVPDFVRREGQILLARS